MEKIAKSKFPFVLPLVKADQCFLGTLNPGCAAKFGRNVEDIPLNM